MNTNQKIIAAIHQPNYIPWLGYFFKIAHVDKFIFLDSVVYPDRSFINRNSIKTPSGSDWLTIPVRKSGRTGQLICEVEPDNTRQWQSRHLARIKGNYGGAQFFKEIFTLLEPHFHVTNGSSKSVAEFNIEMIRAISTYIGINTQFICSRNLEVFGRKDELNLDICRVVGADTYLAGTGSKCYQDEEKFEKAGIGLVYSSFSQEPYPQLFGDFVTDLSIVDVLMNCGRSETRRLLGIET